ncbi:MAG: 30S ribosomal protein S17 [Bdellovibrionales bacterium]
MKKTAADKKQTSTEVRSRNRNEKVGVVVSEKMKDTIVVEVYRMVSHAKYGKFFRRANTFSAHNTKNTAKLGDRVRIEETRPLSKTKRWRLVEVVTKAGDQGVEL